VTFSSDGVGGPAAAAAAAAKAFFCCCSYVHDKCGNLTALSACIERRQYLHLFRNRAPRAESSFVN